jgi:DNA-binding response OmpR family regulator
VLSTGGIDLDVAARTCTVHGTPVELTPREFSVVEYLMRREGEVVPKSEILEHVWDFAFDGGDNVVEVHVSALRRKLGSGSIETVRGAGYRMGPRAR